jgi:hypothetical protein
MNAALFILACLITSGTVILCWLSYQHGKISGIAIGREQERNSATQRIMRINRTRGFWMSQN